MTYLKACQRTSLVTEQGGLPDSAQWGRMAGATALPIGICSRQDVAQRARLSIPTQPGKLSACHSAAEQRYGSHAGYPVSTGGRFSE